MRELTDRTIAVVRKLFPVECEVEVEDLLKYECADNLPLWVDETPEGLERIRFAVLKLSGGAVGGLVEAIEIAQTDWRDSLIGAGFGRNITEHERWADEYLKDN